MGYYIIYIYIHILHVGYYDIYDIQIHVTPAIHSRLSPKGDIRQSKACSW